MLLEVKTSLSLEKDYKEGKRLGGARNSNRNQSRSIYSTTTRCAADEITSDIRGWPDLRK